MRGVNLRERRDPCGAGRVEQGHAHLDRRAFRLHRADAGTEPAAHDRVNVVTLAREEHCTERQIRVQSAATTSGTRIVGAATSSGQRASPVSTTSAHPTGNSP